MSGTARAKTDSKTKNNLLRGMIACLAIIGLTSSASAIEEEKTAITDSSLAPLVKLIDEDSFSQARALIGQLKKERPDDENLGILCGRFYRKSGLWSASIVEYEKARMKNPQLVEPYLALAEMHLSILSTDIALSMAREAVFRAPHSLAAKEVLISALIANHNVKEADSELMKLMAEDPDDADVLYLSYRVKRNIGEPEKARKDLERAIALKKENVSWLIDLAEIYEATGDFNRAQETIRGYLQIDPQSIKALVKLAEIEEFRLYDLDAARQIYERILAIEPENLTALSGSERLASKRNDVAAAIKRFFYRSVSSIMTLFSKAGAARS